MTELDKLPPVRKRIIDERIKGASIEKDFSVDEAILINLNDHFEELGKFKNLDEALELLNGSGGINDFQKYIRDEDEANEFFGRVIERVNSKEEKKGYESSKLSLSSRASSQMSENLSESQSFKSDKTGKNYTNREEFGYFDNLFRFSLNKDCYIIYEKKEDRSFYIDMISCKPFGNWRGNISVKGSGRVMIYDWLLFLNLCTFKTPII
jgi:hypothetical protein